MTTPSPTPPVPDAALPPPLPTPADPGAMPYGVAPIAVAPPPVPRRGRRRRLLDAAFVTGTIATLPLANWVSRSDAPPAPTLVEAVSEIDASDSTADLEATVADLAARSVATAPRGVPLVTAAGYTADIGPAAPPVAAERAPTPVAAAGDLELVVPSPDAVLVGFHEAALPGTEVLTSLAPLDAVHTVRDVPVAADPVEEQIAPVIALPTRERAQAGSSAIDVAVPEGADVVAPVTGEVVLAAPYSLYGSYGDWRVEIVPDGHPDMRVVLLHIDDLQITVGDRVEAGETVVAGTANGFPFESQIDRFSTEVSGSAHPHVHLEVKRTG